MVALAPAPKRKKRGRERMTQLAAEPADPDAPRVALAARARQMGLDAGDRAVRRDMADPSHGEPATRALLLSEEEDGAKPLIDAYRALTASYRQYTGTVLGVSAYPKTGRIEMRPEQFEARPDDRPDLRSEDERHRDAANAWAGWRDKLDALGTARASAVWTAVFGFADLHDGSRITSAGRRFVEAMKEIAE